MTFNKTAEVYFSYCLVSHVAHWWINKLIMHEILDSTKKQKFIPVSVQKPKVAHSLNYKLHVFKKMLLTVKESVKFT